MKYTLHIAFDSTIGDAVLRTCEYVKKYGESVSPYFEPLLFQKQDSGAIVSRPEKINPTADAVVLALELYYQIPLRWATENKRIELSNGNEIEDFFELKYAQKITEDSPVDSELHLMLYVPLYIERVVESVQHILNNLPISQKYVVNVLAIPYDIAQACDIDHPALNRKDRWAIMRQNADALVQIYKEDSRLQHIFTFQNYNANRQSKNFNYKKFIKTSADLSIALIEYYDVICHHSIVERPFYAINIDSRIIDKYLIIDRWFRAIFANNVQNNIINPDEIDQRKVKEVHQKILTQEALLIKQYKKQLTDKGIPNADYDNIFTTEVVEKLRNIIQENIEENALNIGEQQYLYSLFNQLSETTNLVDGEVDESIWKLEDLKLEELDIAKDSDLRKTYEQLKQHAKDITELKDVIREQEILIEQLQNRMVEEYPYDGELTDEGFKIGNNIFKPYKYKETPLQETYQTPVEQSLPSSIDLRKDFSPIRNQQHQGACSSFSLVSVVEYFLHKTLHENTDLSEAFVYYNARDISHTTNEDSGCTFHDVIKSIQDKGVCMEDLCPFNPERYNEQPTEAAYVEAESRKVTEAKNVNIKVEDIKSALAQGYPVVISIRVFDSFVKNVSGFVNIPTEEELKDDENHAMVVCGYSDYEGFFIVRNSWGTNFGDNGYCYLPYDYIRTPNLVNAAYVVTGLSIGEDIGSDFAKVDSLLKGKDANTQYAIVANIIREKQRTLSENRSKLEELQANYFQLYNQLAYVANMDLSLNDIKEDIDKRREQLEQELSIALEKQAEGRRFPFLRRFGDSESPKIRRIRKELEAINAQMDNQRNLFRMNNSIMQGLSNINQEFMRESLRVQQLSNDYQLNIQRIFNQNDLDDAEYQSIRESGIVPVDDIYALISTLPNISEIFTTMTNTLRDVIHGNIGFYEVIEDVRTKIVNILLENFDYNITNYLDNDIYQSFFDNIPYSSVMVQIDGGLPSEYGDETKYFFSNLEELPKQIGKLPITNLKIADTLRMTFLHIEKYEVDDLYMFREESWNRDCIKNQN